MTDVQQTLDRLKADFKLARELETSPQHEREVWEAQQRVDAAGPVLVTALERIMKEADTATCGIVGSVWLKSTISDALVPLQNP